MAGIKCPRLGLGETGIWREISMTSLCSLFTRDTRLGLAPAGLPPGQQQEQTKEFMFWIICCSHDHQRNMCNVYFGWQGRVLPPLIANPKTSNPILTPKNHLRLLLFLQTCKVLWESEVLIQNPSISKGTRELYVTVMSLYDFMAATKLLLCNNCKSVYMVVMEVTLFLIREPPLPSIRKSHKGMDIFRNPLAPHPTSI